MTKHKDQGQVKTGRSSAAIIGVGAGIALGMWLASAMSLLDDRTTIEPIATVTRHETAPVSAPVIESPALETPRVVTPRVVTPAVAPAAAAAEAARAVAPAEAARAVAPAEVVRTVAPAETAEVIDAPRLVMTVPVTASKLHDRMKPVLARGTRINIAVEGFSDAEQFATLAHAARNTQVPFILLKHRVLTERLSLADAIRASKPGLDADAEAERARRAAKSDLAALNATAD